MRAKKWAVILGIIFLLLGMIVFKDYLYDFIMEMTRPIMEEMF